MISFSSLFSSLGRRNVGGLPEGFDALFLTALFRDVEDRDVLHVCRDDARLAAMADAARIYAPDLEILEFPAWDCVPYDRASPNVEILSRRLDALTRLGGPRPASCNRLVLTTVSAVSQRVPRKEVFNGATFRIVAGKDVNRDALMTYLARHGYSRIGQVMEPGEYAVHGGIVDVFPPGQKEPARIDLFGDDVDGIRFFDPLSQRTTTQTNAIALKPMSEVLLTETAIARFRTRFRETFGTVRNDDVLYEAISAGRKIQGMEHWLPLFYESLSTLFDYVPTAAITLDYQVEEVWKARIDSIGEYFEARLEMEKQGLDEGRGIYHPVRPETMFLEPSEFWARIDERSAAQFFPYAPSDLGDEILDAQGRPGRDFADVRARTGENVYDAVRRHLVHVRSEGRRTMLSACSPGSRDRLTGVLRDHDLDGMKIVEDWREACAACDKEAGTIPVLVMPLERGFRTPEFEIVAEQDILGDRLARPNRKKRRAEVFLQDAAALANGDLVVHVEHGIGRYDGLEILDIGGAPHDCLRLIYDGGDKLFLPVENIEMLSRYGSETAGVALDRLGSPAWQARKAKLKNRIQAMAAELIRVAALRQLRQGEILTPPEGMFDEFCARFPYVETDDQLRAIGDVLSDLASGKPMDRLICGDVGFGKTEVALRAACVAAVSGMQVAVVAPTTLLARQHYFNFLDRFRGFPITVGNLSRFASAREAVKTKENLAKGTVDIVVGTHALLAPSMAFKRLGLLVVDEEQHFGVAHKERLKKLKNDIHVLTLSATPIPRTLQMALSGVRELSIIATPPVDRLAIRTFVLPFDGVIVREAILRERHRGGQSFFVCPRLVDIDHVLERLRKLVPEVKLAVAHGQMSASQLEEAMEVFAEGRCDVLVSTNIIESGLDMPRVNTIIVHRADMFGLGQLYQLRGRVGRGKQRGYAYLTLPPDKTLTAAAERRLTVMQTLDSLGAGFTLASHDLDIRGAGNLLGEEQSGHVKEVGIELYQSLLEEAVAAAKAGEEEGGGMDEQWSPQISLGMPILIPESYVRSLEVRLSLYRRIGGLEAPQDIEAFAAELIDRFGPLPAEVENLLQVVAVKQLCRVANIEKIESGPKGSVFSLKENTFPNPLGLMSFIKQNAALLRVRPDQKIVCMSAWPKSSERVSGIKRLLEQLATIARQPPA